MAENEPAFPTKVKRSPMSDPLATPREVEFPGMTLRDWFAGQAFGEIMGGVENIGASTAEARRDMFKQVAEIIYEAADAMLEARK